MESRLSNKRIVDLSEVIPEEEWCLQRPAVEAARERGLPFALGGGLAFSAYSRQWRNTKDLDLFILPSEREAMIQAITDAGFVDYYDLKPYDRTWIYRGFREHVILDLIWTMPNHRMEVDAEWLARSSEVQVHGMRLKMLPLEELILTKLFILQRDRCDWPDLLNIIFAEGSRLDWDPLLRRVGEDAPVLGGLMSVFGWLCPARARALPDWIWSRMGLMKPQAVLSEEETQARARVLDTRDWFGPTVKGEDDADWSDESSAA